MSDESELLSREVQRLQALLVERAIPHEIDPAQPLSSTLCSLIDSLERALQASDARPEDDEALEPTAAALAESELRFRATFEQAAVGIAHVRPDGRFLRLNQEFCQITGYPHDELVPQSFMDITHPDDLQRDVEHAACLARGEISSYSMEKRYIRKDGSTAWVTLTCSAVRERSGALKYFIGVIKDISRRRTAEQEREQLLAEIQRQSSELHAIFRSIPDPLLVYDTQRRITRTNPAAISTFGWDPLEASIEDTATRLDIRHVDGHALAPEELPTSRVLRGEEGVFDEPIRFRNAQGHEQIASVTSVPLTRNGDILGAVTLWRDITEREHILGIALRDAERRSAELNAIISSIADAVTIHDRDGSVLQMNPAAEEILGCPLDTLRALPPEAQRQLLSPLSQDTSIHDCLEEAPLRRALRGEVVHGVLATLVSRGGQRRWLSVSASPIRTDQGDLLGAVASFTDVTDMHELQERMTLFVHTISHDLRNPLSTMSLQIELLREIINPQALSPGVERALALMARTRKQMTLMLADLVDSTSLDGGQLRLSLERVELGAYLDDLLRRSEAILDASRIVNELGSDLPRVLVDTGRLERILLNLLTNGLKYSDGPVHIRAKPRGADTVISIIDHGEGIPPEQLPFLFSRFVRASTHRNVQGIGLGLYIVKQLVEAHGGTIWAESEPGQGSVFSFTLTNTL